MILYIAAPMKSDLKLCKHCLLSYYDIYISTIPFRKGTFNYIKYENQQNTITQSSGNS